MSGYLSSSFTSTHLNTAPQVQIGPQRIHLYFLWQPHLSRGADLTCGGWGEKHQSIEAQFGLYNRKGNHLLRMQNQAGQNGHIHTGNLADPKEIKLGRGTC